MSDKKAERLRRFIEGNKIHIPGQRHAKSRKRNVKPEVDDEELFSNDDEFLVEDNDAQVDAKRGKKENVQKTEASVKVPVKVPAKMKDAEKKSRKGAPAKPEAAKPQVRPVLEEDHTTSVKTGFAKPSLWRDFATERTRFPSKDYLSYSSKVKIVATYTYKGIFVDVRDLEGCF